MWVSGIGAYMGVSGNKGALFWGPYNKATI